MTDDGWMLIETAPLDGTAVLLWCECYQHQIGLYYDGCFETLDGVTLDQSIISHWRPLPAPPAEGE